MNQPKLYEEANNVPRRDGRSIIREFSSVLKWRLDGKDSLLDIGIGSGDVLMDFLYPIMPKDFKQIIGIDISLEMVRHCSEKYSHMDNVDFKVLDIGTETLPKELIGEFDHVTSFFCLNWVPNQRQALENIYQMLQADGDCLLVFLASHIFYDIYNIMSVNSKWSQYMKDKNIHISPFQYSKDPRTEFGRLLEDTGFVEYSVEVRDKIFVYEGLENMKKNVSAVNPFIQRIPTCMREEFLDEFIKVTIGLNLREPHNDDFRFKTSYKLIVAYAKK